MYIFISHSSVEAHIAGELCEVIENNGNRCFIAPRDIRSGYPYAEEITNGIDSADVMLLVLSKAANESPHVLREVERAVTKSVPILVYKAEEVELTKSMEYFLMTHQWMVAGRDSYQDVVNSINAMGQLADKEKVPCAYKGDTIPQKKKGSKNIYPMLIGAVVAVLLAVIVVLCVVIISGRQNYENNNINAGNGGGNISQSESETGKGGIEDKESQEAVKKDVKVGDTLTMGTYNGEAMYWRVLKLNGNQAVIVARDVISMKAYDAPESGRYNHDGTTNYAFDGSKLQTDMQLQAYVRGNNSWDGSNIRTWLNSSAEVVKYEGQAPVSSATAEGVNGYHTEKGFLCSFTQKEQAAILETKVETKGSVLSGKDKVVTNDKVFLLSKNELKWFEEGGMSMLAAPTQKAIENNKDTWYQGYCVDMGIANTMWWLRDPVENSSSQCYLVGNGYRQENIYTWEVGVEAFGIRPAMTIDVTSGAFSMAE
ncbi:MAG: toll/interleukin-1 receptor domain-containing protein [Lachnospira sp.]|nr:toll/interleukin-1 receptor domain-containing protein [Lachnospira sp.]